MSYSKIASSLEIPSEDVEVWLIDIIRAGLVEGKLSQARQELLVHRSTYRTFGKEDWEELDSRLEEWKTALEGVLASDQIAALREQEQPRRQRLLMGLLVRIRRLRLRQGGKVVRMISILIIKLGLSLRN